MDYGVTLHMEGYITEINIVAKYYGINSTLMYETLSKFNLAH